MEERERSLIQSAVETNHTLRRLYEEHLDLERKLVPLQNRPYLTAPEERELRRLKEKKLRGVDRMMKILAEHEASRPEQVI